MITARHGASARRVPAIVALAAVTMATTVSAQTLTAPGSGARFISAADSIAGPASRNPNRLVRAAVFGASGAVALGFAGFALVGGCTTKCDVLEWDEVIVGGLVGAIAGSTIGAAAPRGRGLCTTEQRYGMGLGGAFLGTLATLALAQLPHSRPGVIVTIPLGAVMFMGGC